MKYVAEYGMSREYVYKVRSRTWCPVSTSIKYVVDENVTFIVEPIEHGWVINRSYIIIKWQNYSNLDKNLESSIDLEFGNIRIIQSDWDRGNKVRIGM